MSKIIAHVHAYVGHGREAGAETTLANLLESLVEAGWEAEVVLPEADKDHPISHDYWINNVHVISENLTGHNFQHYAKRADVLITHLECSERTAYIGRPAGIPVVQLIHNTFWQTEGYLREGCDLAVYNSEWVAKHHMGEKAYATRLINRVGDDLARIDFKAPSAVTWPHVVVHPQIEPSRYIAAGLNDHITMVNLFKNKGANVFWELARRFPDQKFLGIKGGYGKQEVPDSVPPNVLLVKNTPDMKIVYGMTKIVLMPSHYESFGRIAIEAAASGIPTIASPTEGLIEALGPEAPYCDPKDIDEWELELTILLGNDIAYGAASKMAKSRSDYWNAVRPAETENFVTAVNQLIRR